VFVGELLLAKKNITLAFDATTEDQTMLQAQGIMGFRLVSNALLRM
jgi:hypothetical protein